MRNFEKGLIKLAYYIGPLLFGLNKYALEHPDICLNENTTLYRKLTVNSLGKYVYKLSVEHIICFPSLTSTSILKDRFNPTNLGKDINADPFKNKGEKKDSNDIVIEMKIKYRHQEGNITPGIDISKLSKNKSEKEILLFPFTFLRINSFTKKVGCEKTFILDMDIINRRHLIEYDLEEKTKYKIEELEELYEENKILYIEDAGTEKFEIKEEGEKSRCNLF